MMIIIWAYIVSMEMIIGDIKSYHYKCTTCMIKYISNISFAKILLTSTV